MKPATIKFLTYNNEAWQDGFLLTFVDGSAFDFGDYTPLRLQVKYSEDHPLPLLDLTDSDHLTVESDGGLGIDVSLDAFDGAITSLLGTYVYDIVGTSAGEPVVLCVGTIQFAQGKTY